MPDRTRSFWGSETHEQTAGSVDIEIERVLEVRANLVYRLTGYRMLLSSRGNSPTFGDSEANFALGLTVWEPSTATTVDSSFDSRRTQNGLFPFQSKGTIDALMKRQQMVVHSAIGVNIIDLTLDTGWVVCELVIPSVVLTAVSEILGADSVWQFGCILEWESIRVNADRAAAIAQQWGVPRAGETTF